MSETKRPKLRLVKTEKPVLEINAIATMWFKNGKHEDIHHSTTYGECAKWSIGIEQHLRAEYNTTPILMSTFRRDGAYVYQYLTNLHPNDRCPSIIGEVIIEMT